MTKTEVDEKTKARWAFGKLWNKLHFGHISKGDKWSGMEAAYRFGLDPFKKFVQNGLSARWKRKELMTFQIEPITSLDQRPIRAKLASQACVVVIRTDGATEQVIRDWPVDVEVDKHTIFDEDKGEYIKIDDVYIKKQFGSHNEVAITVDRDLVGSANLLLKGHPIHVVAESTGEAPDSVLIKGTRYPVIEAKTTVSGERHELLIARHRSEVDPAHIEEFEVISVNQWKPERGTQLLDGSTIITESWGGRTEITLNSAPESPYLTTTEGIRVYWTEIEEEGVWVKLSAEVESDAVVDPIDILFEDSEIRMLQSKKGKGKEYKILERNRESRIIRLSELPNVSELTLPLRFADLKNQKAAIERLQRAPLSHHIPLMELTTRLDQKHIKAWNDCEPLRTPIVPWMTRVGSGAEGSAEQQRFILKALASDDFAFLEGPPGSGKTETIGELILQLLSDTEHNYRILLCGSTQASIDNVLSRFGENELVQPLRIVNSRRWRNEPLERDQLVYDSDIHRWTEPEQVDDLKQRLGSAAADLSDEDLSEMVLRRSNLVCATIGGVPQHPLIKEALRDEHVPPKALFDVLIIDEASKTTFTEFLVPAIFCKKWVLVGDVAQLPPFTNAEDIAGMLDLLESVDEEIPASSLRKACLNIRRAIDDFHLRKVPRLLIESSETVLAMQREWESRRNRGNAECGDLRLKDISVGFIGSMIQDCREEGMVGINTSSLQEDDWEQIGRIRLTMMDCNLIVISKSDAKRFADTMLPNSHLTPEMMYENVKMPSQEILPARFRYRLSLEKDRLMMRFEGEEPRRNPFRMNRGLNGETTTWGRQIAWRIQRVYEMQTSENSELRDKYLNETESLLPCASNSLEWAQEVEKIRCFALPSILESLQHGFMGRKGKKGSAPKELAPRVPTTLSQGFPKRAKDSRFESIRHQHRMHWSISKFPRDEFYGADDNSGEQRLQDAGGTLNSRTDFNFILDTRPLAEQERRYWVNVPNGSMNKDGNIAEARKAATMLVDLFEWFEQEGEDRETLSVALLSPYVNQSRTLRKEANLVLKKKGGSIRGTRGTIRLNAERTVKVFCSTIDKFQGQEADVILLSLRNVERQGNIDSPNRANVGLTRAREALFIIGNSSNYKRARDPMLKRLANGAEMATNQTYWRRRK